MIKAMADTPTTFIPKNTGTVARVRLLSSRTEGCTSCDATTSPTKPANHHTARRLPDMSIAPKGASNDHRITALALTKPPSSSWRKNGRRRMRLSCMSRNTRYRRVIANTARLAPEAAA
ncbi:MAG TPA: hypothetical protein VJA44_03360 [Acidimicrobiia bacterium]|nr:hypothetical protein [Acidimicrobiia bacterium]